jgi:biopolymer transport protein ExbD|tara:strand:- start:2535 stop:2957 length:423 start_codon:yes stop_codon:yes gene_type:complete
MSAFGPKKSMRDRRLGALPLISLIDVVFLLLVYFLVTSDFSQQERRLPSAVQTEGGGVRSVELQPQIVEITTDDQGVRFTIGQVMVRDKASLVSVLGRLPREPGVAVRASPQSPISAIATALQAARDAGFEKRSYVPRGE